MSDVVISNPVINSPFDEPTRHFRFDEDGITEEIVAGRRVSSYFMPIARTKKKQQLAFETEWTSDRLEENRLVNQIRGKVDLWRRGGYVGVTPPASTPMLKGPCAASPSPSVPSMAPSARNR